MRRSQGVSVSRYQVVTVGKVYSAVILGGREGGPRKFPVTERRCLEPVTSSLGRMLMAQFLVCPAPEGLRIAKVTGLRNYRPMEQRFHRFLYPISHPPCSTTKMSFFTPTLRQGKGPDVWTCDTEGCQEFRGTVPP